MRRFLILSVCLATAGVAVLVLLERRRARRFDGRQVDITEAVADDSSPDHEVDAQLGAVERVDSGEAAPAPPAVHEPPVTAPESGQERLEQLMQVRAEVVERVDRRSLFAMAHVRGLPNHQLFTMTSKQLLEAILAAEGLPPADVLPSSQTEERLRDIAAEAFRRHEQFLAEDAAHRVAG